jgi:hypothetical protein
VLLIITLCYLYCVCNSLTTMTQHRQAMQQRYFNHLNFITSATYTLNPDMTFVVFTELVSSCRVLYCSTYVSCFVLPLLTAPQLQNHKVILEVTDSDKFEAVMLQFLTSKSNMETQVLQQHLNTKQIVAVFTTQSHYQWL